MRTIIHTYYIETSKNSNNFFFLEFNSLCTTKFFSYKVIILDHLIMLIIKINKMFPCRVSQPIFLGKFISYFTAGRENISRTQLNWYAFGLIMSSLISVVLGQTLAMALLHLGLKIKIACCSLIYRKVTC